MIGKDKALEVIGYLIQHGLDETCAAYNLTAETLNRYKREAKKHFGESLDTVIKLSEKFTIEELDNIASSKQRVRANSVKYSFKGTEIKMLVMTDTHFGSSYTNGERIKAAMDEGLAEDCSMLIHVGDVTEGMPNRPNSIYEMSHLGYTEQRDESIRQLKPWPRKMYLLSGNHDDFYNTKLGAGVHIVEDIAEALPDAEFVGQGSGDILLEPHGIKIGLFHGNDASSPYALSYRLQRIINNMNGGTKPHVFITGHDHKSFVMPSYRNVHAVAAGCIQDQTPWMSDKGLQAMCGFYIIKMCVAEGEVKWFQPRFYPFFK